MQNEFLSNRHIGSKFSMLSKTSIVILVLFEFPPFAIFPCLFKLKSAHFYRNTRTETRLSRLYNFFNHLSTFCYPQKTYIKKPQTHQHMTTCNLSTRKCCIIILSFPSQISYLFQKRSLVYISPDSVNALALLRYF